MKVLFIPEVIGYFLDLAELLYEKNYFGFEETAFRYVDDLFEEIKATLPAKQAKFAPSYFDRYGKGMYYAVFRKSKATQWYVFFTKYQKDGDILYLVRYISNNHTTAQYL